MYFLTDHITAVHGVQALLPTKHTEELGRYKVLVTEKDFQSVCNHMKKYIMSWHEQYVEPDALNPEYKYPGPLNVAPIDADEYSDDPICRVPVIVSGNQGSVFIDVIQVGEEAGGGGEGVAGGGGGGRPTGGMNAPMMAMHSLSTLVKSMKSSYLRLRIELGFRGTLEL